MHIVIDCFKLIKGVGKSIGIYNVALAIAGGLAEVISAEGSGDKLTVMGNSFNRKDFEIPGVSFYEVSDLDPKKRLDFVYWELTGVNSHLRRLGADIVIFPRGFAPIRCVIRDAVIIHDMIPFYYDEVFPGYFGFLENLYIKSRLKASAKHAYRVITISEASKKDIVKYTGIGEDRIRVIHDSCEASSYGDKTEGEPYILAVTSDLPHKNAGAVVRAYEAYLKTAADPLKLVIIGIEDSAAYGASEGALKKTECHKYIGDVNEMKRYISNAEVFLFLSLKEGFGLPPLEAMAAGVPVVCSKRSSLPEVVGDAGALVDPDDPREVASALDKVICDRALKDSLVLRGYENCKRFDAGRIFREYYENIREIVEADR